MASGEESGLAMRMSLQKVVANRSDEYDRNERDGCSYLTLLQTICSLEKDQSGIPLRKCEKTERLLRKCGGRPPEVVNSKVDITEDDVSTSVRPFALENEISSGGKYMAHEWNERSAPGGGSGEYPFHGLFERNGPRFAGAFEELVQAAEDAVKDVLGTFDSAEDQQQVPAANVKHPFTRFRGRFPGGVSRNESPTSEDPSNSQQHGGVGYESFGRGIQEV